MARVLLRTRSMGPDLPRRDDWVLNLARLLAAIGTRWHRADCEGLDELPPGPALLVGNHGLYGFEAPIFFYLVHQSTGRLPIGLADRRVFGWPPMRQLLARCGGHVGSFEHALALLRREQLVVCYPGGSREVFKAPRERYQLRWERAIGFARLAICAQAPIVPFAALGVDDTYRNFGHLPGTRALLGRYAAPLALGLGPLPLPVRLRFRIGAPIAPPRELDDAAALKQAAADAVRALLERAPRGATHEIEAHGEAAAAATPVVR